MPDPRRTFNAATGLAYASEYFMGRADVQKAARKLAARLDELGIPHAIVGGLAVTSHGHARVTTDVDVLITADGLRKFKDACIGLAWVEKFPGSRGVRDVEFNTPVDFLLAGDIPGDGSSSRVRFPDPTSVAEVRDGLRFIDLRSLIELKLACGLSRPDRPRDFDDVIQLVRTLTLPRDFAATLHPSVRAKFDELWQAAQMSPGEY